LLLLQGAGQAIGGPFRSLAFLAPRGHRGSGPNGFTVNRTAAAAQITHEKVGPDWRLELVAGPRTLSFSRAQLLAMPQQTHDLPIACVEGWSTTQRWTGVPIGDLARLAGFDHGALVRTKSLAVNGVFDAAVLAPEQIGDRRSMIALRVNGTDLSLDHGFPARVIGPGIPGVHCTKWVHRLIFEDA
jgi:DMSO/TMAO reductase YedYZ molybdopterin-dependent catalytic subunit